MKFLIARPLRQTGAALVLAALSACNPVLNWREVTVERLKVLLPCKPDRAQRPVALDESMVNLDMAGCEAGEALFAVSHARVPDGASADKVLEAWQRATLGNMQVQKGADVLLAYRAAQGRVGASTIHLSVPLKVDGRKPTGEAVNAELVWFRAGADIYHLALYGDVIRPEMAEPFFTQSQLR